MQIKKTLSRIYVNDMNTTLGFYESLLNEKCGLRFKYDRFNLELAQIGNILLIAGRDEALMPFKKTTVTFLVDSITEFKDFLLKNGVQIIRDIATTPTGGFNMTVRHLDDTVAEYVEFC